MTKIGKEKASQVGASAAETAKKVNAEQHAVQGGLEGLSDDFVKRSEHKVVQTQFTPLSSSLDSSRGLRILWLWW